MDDFFFFTNEKMGMENKIPLCDTKNHIIVLVQYYYLYSSILQ
jgi:hypothetical protein